MDVLADLTKRMEKAEESCRDCRENLIGRCAHLDTSMAVLTSRYESVERLVYAFCGTVLLAALVATLRIIGWKS